MTELNEHQLAYLRGLVRQSLRKQVKGAEQLKTKHGEEYDGKPDERIQFIRNTYRLLGGDPDNIEGVK